MPPNDDTEMCRHFFPLLTSFAHIVSGAVMVAMGARCSRGCRGAGSIPAHGSDKTNEEVLAKLLTWESRPREISSSQGWWGDLSALFLVA